MNLQGCGTALVTPFRPDGSIDEATLHANVDFQITNGISLLIPCGTTGEAATLTEQETIRVIEITIAAAAGRVPVFAGCTHNSTHVATANARKLAAIHGLTGLLTANPYYNRPSQEGQYQHFLAIAEATELPILLYVQITQLLTQCSRSFRVFAGDDTLALPVIALGGCGLISVASNAIPYQMSQIVEAALANDWSSARRLNRRFFTLMQAHFIEPSPAPIKAVMALLGHGNEEMRLPMVPVIQTTRRRLERLIGELGLLRDQPGDDLRMF
jgi:4-hydroxy-tetrahydrodipicolinate synthase